jgi:hypothetical protein
MTAAIMLRSHDGRFEPRWRVDGSASWSLSQAPAWLEIRLAWHTEGKGTKEVLVVARERFRAVSAQDQRTFALSLPEMPYTYHGRIVSILWSVDVFGPSRRFWRREELLATLPIVVSPTREPFGERRP